MLTFYFAPGSSSMAPHIALHETGAKFDSKPLSLARKEMRLPEYLAINPEATVPALVIDGRPLTEVAGIMFYLARAYPAAKLLPHNDPEAEAHVVSWMSFTASTLHWARTRGLEYALEIYKRVDRRLESKEWVAGQYSIADIHLFRLFWRFEDSLHPPVEMLPNLMAHHRRMMERPAVRKTIEVESAIGYELPK
jgi:glutathione S-transferase